MLWRLKSWLHRSFGSSRSLPSAENTNRERLLREAAWNRSRAFEAVNDAYARRDDRDLGRAQMAFVQATTDLLKLEVGR